MHINNASRSLLHEVILEYNTFKTNIADALHYIYVVINKSVTPSLSIAQNKYNKIIP